MINDEIIELIEPTPVIKKKECKIAALVIALGLTYGSFMVAALIWYLYDLFFGVGALLISYLVIGIIRSKLRNSAIPLTQQEYQYSDKAIATWFVSRRLLCDMG